MMQVVASLKTMQVVAFLKMMQMTAAHCGRVMTFENKKMALNAVLEWKNLKNSVFVQDGLL